MNCIDAIEGTIKNIVDQLHQDVVEERLDDSGYIQSIKAIVQGTEQFVKANPEIVEDSQILTRIIYGYAKEKWLSHVDQLPVFDDAPTDPQAHADRVEYFYYYYDYIYDNGEYPI